MKTRFLAPLFRCCSAALMLLACQVQAKNLGTYGATFEIVEPDLLQVMEAKLNNLKSSGKLDELQKAWQQQAKTSLEHPKPVAHIRHTSKPRTFYYDPSITVPEDLKDHAGRIFQKAGTRINPLSTVSMTKALLFLDGDDKAQVDWALREDKTRHGKVTLILTKGSPLKLSEQAQKRFYFDQNGALMQKLGIKQVPARVTEDKLRLKIEELSL